jgi:hypothetical protein
LERSAEDTLLTAGTIMDATMNPISLVLEKLLMVVNTLYKRYDFEAAELCLI